MSFPRFHYFTAGSGGTGPGVLATSFFLMADKAVTYHKGQLPSHHHAYELTIRMKGRFVRLFFV